MSFVGIELLLEKVHGHLALLGIALCFHPPIALRKARGTSRAARLSAYLATLVLATSVAIGWVVYPDYRRDVRQTLYLTSRWLGKAFEVKEHVGTFAVALVLAGAFVTWLSARPGMGPHTVAAIRRIYLSAALLATASAAIGLFLSTVYGFAYGAG